MSKFEGSIFGKDIFTYSSRGGRQYSPDEIGRYLGKFKLCNALALIGKLSHHMLVSHKNLYFIEGYDIPIANGTLAYLSMRLIEKSNDYRSKDMTIDDLLVAVDMFFGLPDLFQECSDNPQSCLMRFGASQFDYDRENRNLLARTLIIYRDLWNTVSDASQVNIDTAIQSFSGLTLHEILVLGLFFSGRAKDGRFGLEEMGEYPATIKDCLTLDKQQTFVNWISCKYEEFRSRSVTDLPIRIEYEKFRFNPLCVKPIIIPDRNLSPGFSQVYLTPIPTLIYGRVTRGIFFSLADHFRESGDSNPFRSAFGVVFQEYVGLILKKALGEDNVQREWRYGLKGYSKDTPDWFVIKDGVAVLIEVKQAGLSLIAKQWGDTEDIKKALKRSIGAGVKQMWEFERAIETGLCTCPDWFNGVKISDRLVVTYDRPYFLNSTLRDEIRQMYTLPGTYHWHTISVEELEYFLGATGTNFTKALSEKRLAVEEDEMDFRDYCSRNFSKDKCTNSYLDSVDDNFCNELGLFSK